MSILISIIEYDTFCNLVTNYDLKRYYVYIIYFNVENQPGFINETLKYVINQTFSVLATLTV